MTDSEAWHEMKRRHFEEKVALIETTLLEANCVQKDALKTQL